MTFTTWWLRVYRNEIWNSCTVWLSRSWGRMTSDIERSWLGAVNCGELGKARLMAYSVLFISTPPPPGHADLVVGEMENFHSLVCYGFSSFFTFLLSFCDNFIKKKADLDFRNLRKCILFMKPRSHMGGRQLDNIRLFQSYVCWIEDLYRSQKSLLKLALLKCFSFQPTLLLEKVWRGGKYLYDRQEESMTLTFIGTCSSQQVPIHVFLMSSRPLSMFSSFP